MGTFFLDKHRNLIFVGFAAMSVMSDLWEYIGVFN